MLLIVEECRLNVVKIILGDKHYQLTTVIIIIIIIIIINVIYMAQVWIDAANAPCRTVTGVVAYVIKNVFKGL